MQQESNPKGNTRVAKTHCKNGHERSPDNVSKWGNCIQCQRAYQKNYRREHPKTGTKGGGNENSGRYLSEERKALLDAAVADGWPIRQIIATYGIGTSVVKRYYPNYKGISLEEAHVLSCLSRQVNQNHRKCA